MIIPEENSSGWKDEHSGRDKCWLDGNQNIHKAL